MSIKIVQFFFVATQYHGNYSFPIIFVYYNSIHVLSSFARQCDDGTYPERFHFSLTSLVQEEKQLVNLDYGIFINYHTTKLNMCIALKFALFCCCCVVLSQEKYDESSIYIFGSVEFYSFSIVCMHQLTLEIHFILLWSTQQMSNKLK